MTHNKTTIGNVCFLHDKEKEQILLLNRSFEPMKDLYTGVGGKTNFEESIHESCIREVKEETGLQTHNLQLKAILKTVLKGKNSAWLLFVYTSSDFSGELINCPEGELKWIDVKDLSNIKLIGFIEEIMPYVLKEGPVLEGTIVHDLQGNVLDKSFISMN